MYLWKWLVGPRQPQTAATEPSAITMLLILVEVSVKVACRSTTGRHRLQHRATYSGGSICESGLLTCNLLWWKYLWKWFVGPQSYLHVTYFGWSICVNSLSVHDSHRLKALSYLYATYLSGSICKRGLPVHDSHRAISMLLILVEVPVKTSFWSTTVTDRSHITITCNLFW